MNFKHNMHTSDVATLTITDLIRLASGQELKHGSLTIKRSRKRYAVWGIDGSFRYKWVANLVKWWRNL